VRYEIILHGENQLKIILIGQLSNQ
jgi:hypothetical protein